LKASTAKKHIDEIWNEMITHFKLFAEAGDQEELHKFRVAVKKIRSFFILIQLCNNDNDFLKNFEPVIKVFKQAGIIRDTYLEMQFSEQYQFTLEDFRSEQQRLLATNIIELRHYAKKDLKIYAKAYRHLHGSITGIHSEAVLIFYQRQLYQIAHILSRRKFDEELHTCRKKIKHLLYNYKVIGKKSTKVIALNVSYFDQLQKLIGNWHDKLSLMDLLSVNLTNDANVLKLKIEIGELQQDIAIHCNGFWSKAIHTS
jgi:CHAD domain-containing protein